MSGSQGARTAPPGWQPDPLGRHQYRYWDGTVWTDQVADNGQVAFDPLNQETAKPHIGAGTAIVPEEAVRAAVSAARQRGDLGPNKQWKEPGIGEDKVVEQFVKVTHRIETAQKVDIYLKGAYLSRAATYRRLGMTTEETRDRLAYLELDEGGGISGTAKRASYGLFGLEHGRTFSAAYDIFSKGRPNKERADLMKKGRAVSVGWCQVCNRPVDLSPDFRCPARHKQIAGIVCVVPEDRTRALAAVVRAQGYAGLCSVCGAAIGPGLARCPACGHDFAQG
jgi:hypothetical protein